jgi:hypothetical protein
MPVDFITIPFAILGALLLVGRLIVFRLKSPPRSILVLNWVLFAPFLLGVVLPLVVLHVLSLFGSTGAMMRLGGLYRSGLNGNFITSESMSLHYYDEAIAAGSVEAMLLKSDQLSFDLTRKWINSRREFIGQPESPMYKSMEWIEAFDLANKAAATGMLEATHRVRQMSLMPNPRACGLGVYLVRNAISETRRLYPRNTKEYASHLHQSEEWKQGMRLLSQEVSDPWVRDFYFIMLIDENVSGGNEACRRLWYGLDRYTDEECLGGGRERRTKIAEGKEWQSGLRMLEADARSGSENAADLLARAKEFTSR